MKDDNSGQAFPQPVAYTPLGQEVPSYPGMTLRQYFAAKALQGTLSNPTGYETPEHAAEYAVKCADALIAALEK